MSIYTVDVRKSVKFLTTNLGLKEGSWRAPEGKGDFSIKPADLSVFPLGAFNGGLHIIKPDPGFAWRNNFAHNPSIGGHPAIVVQDIEKVKKRLEAADALIAMRALMQWLTCIKSIVLIRVEQLKLTNTNQHEFLSSV